MIISHGHKFVFLHAVKTAGSSVSQWLSERITEPHKDDVIHTPKNMIKRRELFNDRHMSLAALYNVIPKEELKDYYRFCFVRNPYDATLSYYLMGQEKWPDRFPTHKLRSTAFKKWLLEGNREHFPIFREPIFLYRGKIGVNKICRYEKLHHDLAIACRKIGIKHSDVDRIPKINKRPRYDKDDYYDEEAKEIVYDRNSYIINRFQYKYDGEPLSEPDSNG